jgi:diacylglycerol kinase (ATP)
MRRFYYQEKSLFTRPMYCNVCKLLVTDSAYCCGTCEYSSHERCLKEVENSCKYAFLSCTDTHTHTHTEEEKDAKTTSLSSNEPKSPNQGDERSDGSTSVSFPHQFVKRNHSTVHDWCIVCHSPVGSLFGLHGLNCLWCHAKVHEECRARLSSTECPVGRLKRLVLPPTCVRPSALHVTRRYAQVWK